ncbi:hypothetical protein QQG55_51895 [Brugia pahangi]
MKDYQLFFFALLSTIIHLAVEEKCIECSNIEMYQKQIKTMRYGPLGYSHGFRIFGAHSFSPFTVGLKLN